MHPIPPHGFAQRLPAKSKVRRVDDNERPRTATPCSPLDMFFVSSANSRFARNIRSLIGRSASISIGLAFLFNLFIFVTWLPSIVVQGQVRF